MNAETPAIQGIYCADCVAWNVETGMCMQSDADSLMPYAGPEALCSICVLRPAEVCDPDVIEELG